MYQEPSPLPPRRGPGPRARSTAQDANRVRGRHRRSGPGSSILPARLLIHAAASTGTGAQ